MAPLWQEKWMSGNSYLDGFQTLSCLPISSLCSFFQNLFFKYIVTEIFGNASLVFWEWLSSKDLQNRLFSNLPKLNLCLLKIGSNRLSYSKIFKKSSSADHCVSILFPSNSFLLACNSLSLEKDTLNTVLTLHWHTSFGRNGSSVCIECGIVNLTYLIAKQNLGVSYSCFSPS